MEGNKEVCTQCGWQGETIGLGVTWEGYVCPVCRAILISAEDKERMYIATQKRIAKLQAQEREKGE